MNIFRGCEFEMLVKCFLDSGIKYEPHLKQKQECFKMKVTLKVKIFVIDFDILLIFS